MYVCVCTCTCTCVYVCVCVNVCVHPLHTDNAFLSADDIREIREAVATGLGQGAGGHLGQGNLGPGGFDLDAGDNAQAEADGVQMARVKSDAFRMAEVKLRERLMQRMRERGNAHSSEELGSESPHDDQQLEEEEGAEMNAQSERLHNTVCRCR